MNQTQQTQRFNQLKQWLKTYAHSFQLDLDHIHLASSDAGSRQYYRLACQYEQYKTIIAVDAPPPEKNKEFIEIAQRLSQAQVNVPKIFTADLTQGFMLISDLGTDTYLSYLKKHPSEEVAKTLLHEAIDSLIRWQKTSQPNILPNFDRSFIERELYLMPEWYIQRHLGKTLTPAQQQILANTFELLTTNILSQPQGFMLRDFMVRNLMVNTPNPAVIDFQDAVYGPLSYDVASLLRDAFISWDEAFELDCFIYYWQMAKAQGIPIHEDFSVFYQQLEWTGLQRHIKIMGIFSRLYYRDHKKHYLEDLPRFVYYAQRVTTRYRELAPFAKLLSELTEQPFTPHYSF